MSALQFRDDDDGYRAWVADHPGGHVINISRSYSAAQARVHHANCRTINGENPRGGPWTGQYVKICAERVDELDPWAIDHVGEPISRCGRCHPTRQSVRPTSRSCTEWSTLGPVSVGRSEIHGPDAGHSVVEAWADDYIRFERRPEWQEQLRIEIRARCRQLKPATDQVLHATYFGTKHAKADVENLALYNIDSFAGAGTNGVRFELGGRVPLAPSGIEYPFAYRYALATRTNTFANWQRGRRLASFDWTDLGAFAGDKKLAQVWLALARGEAEVAEDIRAHDAPFAVELQIQPPHHVRPALGGLIKGIFDGVICAFQAQTDTAVLSEVVARVAKILPADPTEIEAHLLDQRRAVLGVVPRLVDVYRKGVKWDPADNLCVAGELILAEPVGPGWAIRGQIVEVSN